MSWYVVIKTIKGNAYRYRQRTWRENGTMRTESVYLGRADSGKRQAARRTSNMISAPDVSASAPLKQTEPVRQTKGNSEAGIDVAGAAAELSQQ